ncbi:MAG: menaquinone biosynthesis protein [Acidobacteria bacterium]|nr:menaquinone biosynthesis protein [Acidobacteriota bacterium]
MTSNRNKPLISLIPYLNALPLTRGLQNSGNLFSTCNDLPAESCRKLAAGIVDAGLVSSISLPEIPDISAVDGVCIASEGPVESVLLFSEKPLPEIRSVGLDPASRTSNTLIQILMIKQGKSEYSFSPFHGKIEEGIKEKDAVLAIGDRAFCFSLEHPSLAVMDLAAQWKDFTGLPFVFAMWGLKNDSVLPPALFREAVMNDMESRIKIADSFSRANGFTPRRQQLTRQYLTENLHYTFGSREKESLMLFYRYATELGLIHPAHQLEFV